MVRKLLTAVLKSFNCKPLINHRVFLTHYNAVTWSGYWRYHCRKWFIFSLDLCCGCLQKRIKTFINSHADNPSEISATRIDEWNEDTEREPNGGIEVNASPCIVDTGERRNSVIRGSREERGQVLEERLGPLPPNFTPSFYSLTAVCLEYVSGSIWLSGWTITDPWLETQRSSWYCAFSLDKNCDHFPFPSFLFLSE